ncbi:glycosyltransferase family 4 protein [Pedobacter faecalis]|uniref:glycosyltransferase family 4 protein n=1 Tax=Pedobacter faecalis TaxID=3041495 RepID=UPI00254E3692|nr:glycosyltransferase family 4 protein [Pedobacter sp. ELA7]
MRLAIICSHPIQYYAPVFALLAKQFETKVFYTSKERNAYDTAFGREIRWDIPLLDGYQYEFTSSIKKIKAFNPDFLLLYGWSYLFHLRVLRFFYKDSSILFRGDSTLIEPRSKLRKLLRKQVLNWVYSHVDMAFYVGSANKAYFIRYWLTEKQLRFAPHAVDNLRFREPSESPCLRKKLGIAMSDTVVLYAGKFTRTKNVQLLIRAFTELNLTDAHLILAGSGKLQSDYIRLTESRQNIHFAGFLNQSEMPGAYQACDLFCLPSLSESWGLAINEAMAAGRAILASDTVGACSDLVSRKNGNIFRSNDLSDLKHKLHRLLSCRKTLEEMGRHSELVISNWTFETQVKNITNVLQ